MKVTGHIRLFIGAFCILMF